MALAGRLSALLGATGLAYLALVSGAGAVVLTSPPEGSRTSSTPTFMWRLAPDEVSSSIEYTTNPAPGPDGGFTQDQNRQSESLAAAQTAFTVGNRQPLGAGRWYWRVQARTANYDPRPSRVGSFVVRDERPRIVRFELDYLSCIREFQVSFQYSDNSDTAPRYSVVFRRKRRGRRVATVSLGRADDPASGLSEYGSFRKPRRLRIGRRYYAWLVLRDSARHAARSTPRRIRVRTC